MAVTKAYPENETAIYSYLISSMGLNVAAACGVLANIQHESNFNHQALGDYGTSYGICQWHNDRWSSLKNFCANNRLNSTTIQGQLRYLDYELNTSYYKHILDKLKSVPNTSQGAYDAGWYWCYHFEVPANRNTKSVERGNLAEGTYWNYYSRNTTTVTPTINKGNLIVQEAKKHIGKSYVPTTAGPNTFDQSGFVYYVYRTAINYNWTRKSTYHIYKEYGRDVPDMRAGDLLFFIDTQNSTNKPNITHVGIATGNGDEFIHCSYSLGKVVLMNLSSSEYYKSKYYCTKRLLADSETSGTSNDSSGEVSMNETIVTTGASGGITLTYINSYNEDIKEALEIINEQNLENSNNGLSQYGYLQDTVNGGEFRFYVPEYDTSIQASWEDVSIIGRSASIKGYNSTSSKSVNISLKLFAGVGLYAKSTTGDRVGDLHKDIAFVESLAYPDYSKSIVLPPPVVFLYLGPTLHMRGIVSNVNVRYMKPYDTNLRPMYAELSFDVTHITDAPPDYYDIRNQRIEGSVSGVVTSAITTKEELRTFEYNPSDRFLRFKELE